MGFIRPIPTVGRFSLLPRLSAFKPMHLTRDDSETWHRAELGFFLDYGWRDAAGHGPLYEDFFFPGYRFRYGTARLLRRRLSFVMLCTGALC